MAKFKPWSDKSYLYDQYVNKRRTLAEIVADCKEKGHSVTEMTIYNNLLKFEIPIRGGNRKLGKRSVGGNPDKKKKGGFYG